MCIAHRKRKKLICVFDTICNIHTIPFLTFQLYLVHLNTLVLNIKVPQKTTETYKLPQNCLVTWVSTVFMPLSYVNLLPDFVSKKHHLFKNKSVWGASQLAWKLKNLIFCYWPLCPKQKFFGPIFLSCFDPTTF